MSNEKARDIAIEFVEKSDMRQCVATFAEVREHERYPNEYSVVFDLFSKEGSLIDAPFIVIVDKVTGEPRFQ
jgi:hypothetical protein